MLEYLVISPVKDEERYIRHTLGSMAAQTVKPVRWVIVDDGSSDATPDIVEQFQQQHRWVQLIRLPPGPRRPGAGVVRAFSRGYAEAGSLPHDLVVKLDCDLGFPPNYFERLLAAFEADRKLGIASGVYAERRSVSSSEDPIGMQWVDVEMPHYHACGASKVVRRACFEEIGGFIAERGWDTVDEIRAMAMGWRTTHFPSLRMFHWKPEGSSIGWQRTRKMHGTVYYLTGGSKLFFLLKVLHCVKSKPLVLGAAAMAWGYVEAALQHRARLVTAEELRFYRHLLNRRIVGQVRRAFGVGTTAS